MEVIEIAAGTVEQAIEKAEAQLGQSRDQFRVEVIREGRAGILGVGGREAVIRVSSTTLPEEDMAVRQSHRERSTRPRPAQNGRACLALHR